MVRRVISCMKNHTNHTFIQGENMKGPDGKLAMSVTVGDRGQIVLPKKLREMFDINPGDTLLVLGDEKRGIAIPSKSELQKHFMPLFDSSLGEAEE